MRKRLSTKLVSTSRLKCLKRYDDVIQTVEHASKSEKAREKLNKLFKR